MLSPLLSAFSLPGHNKAEAQAALQDWRMQYPASAAIHLLNDWATDAAQPGAQTLLHGGNPFWLQHLLTQFSTSASVDQPESVEQPIVAPEEQGTSPDESLRKTHTEAIVDSGEEDDDLPPLQDEEGHAPELPSSDRLSHLLQEQAAVLKAPEPVGGLEALIPIEPHHAIDYFGSQGIKPAEKPAEAQPIFTQRVHKFTDWLKQMKRSNFAQAAAEVSPQQEAQVAGLAQASNEGQAVVTEAMAEVYLKQGRPDQASLIYQKLMQLHPAKSAYFAALLEKIS